MKWLVVTCALFTALSGVTASHAQLYKWVDENGKVQYSDTIAPASTDRARKELRSDGTVKTSTERAATAEEKRLAALKAMEDARLKVLQDDRERKDKALLMTYNSLTDFDRVRDRALGTLGADIRALTDREILLGKIIASDGKLSPGTVPPVSPTPAPAATPAAAAPAKPPVAGSEPAKPPPVKSANIVLLEAKSELPRTREILARKRSDLEAQTLAFAADRSRLSGLIDAEKAKQSANSTTAQAPSSSVVTPKKK